MPKKIEIEYTTYFVLFGLVNGQDGEYAIPAGDGNADRQEDGWYVLLEGMTDGEGPYDSEQEADTEAKKMVTDVIRHFRP